MSESKVKDSGDLHKGLKTLAVSAENNTRSYQYQEIAPEVLESFPNPSSLEQDLAVRIVLPEVTSNCPLTHQPDYANHYITYKPKDLCVESKSLKLYIGSYRHQGIFMEATAARIVKDLVELLDPEWLHIYCAFAPRGGMPLHPTASVGEVPEAVLRRTYVYGQVE